MAASLMLGSSESSMFLSVGNTVQAQQPLLQYAVLQAACCCMPCACKPNTTMRSKQFHKAICAPTLACWCLQVGLTLILHIKPRQPEDERKTRRPAKMFSLPGKGYGRQIYAGSVTEVDTVSAPWLQPALGSVCPASTSFAVCAA